MDATGFVQRSKRLDFEMMFAECVVGDYVSANKYDTIRYDTLSPQEVILVQPRVHSQMGFEVPLRSARRARAPLTFRTLPQLISFRCFKLVCRRRGRRAHISCRSLSDYQWRREAEKA